MAYHVAPPIRALEDVRIAAGILTCVKPPGLTNQEAEETQGLVARIVPVFCFYFANGVRYKMDSSSGAVVG